VIDAERYLLECCRYIEMNPVRARLAESAAAYPWSSYRARMGWGNGGELDLHELYLAMGMDAEARRKTYEEWCREVV
jgi:putative transposase